ncbi:unnamed protein product [Periconia digitata]|uniref:Uncharacterized protein n=1 Tax=Periconia digitata TaxID=1303443 RepID=A0A9W4UIQ0_9PLEO|nr:unnamed protein product [Periconia digitata]
MFYNTLSIIILLSALHQAVAFICLEAFSDCPKTPCSEQSTGPCKCPSTDTYCDFSVETCAGTYGNCIEIVTKSIRVFTPLYTSTDYVATVSTYSSVLTSVQYTTNVQTDNTISTVLVTEATTKTVTESNPSRKLALRQPELSYEERPLQKRVVVGTSTRTTTISDDGYCSTSQDPQCTDTIQATSTIFYPTTTNIYSTIVSAQQKVASVTSTVVEEKTTTITMSGTETTSGTRTIASSTFQSSRSDAVETSSAQTDSSAGPSAGPAATTTGSGSAASRSINHILSSGQVARLAIVIGYIGAIGGLLGVLM